MPVSAEKGSHANRLGVPTPGPFRRPQREKEGSVLLSLPVLFVLLVHKDVGL